MTEGELKVPVVESQPLANDGKKVASQDIFQDILNNPEAQRVTDEFVAARKARHARLAGIPEQQPVTSTHIDIQAELTAIFDPNNVEMNRIREQFTAARKERHHRLAKRE